MAYARAIYYERALAGLFPDAKPGVDFELFDDGAAVHPLKWDEARFGKFDAKKLTDAVQAETVAAARDDIHAAAKAECARRIFAAASANTQNNLNAYFALLGSKPTLSSAEQADVAAFAQALGWIGAMRAKWVALADAGDTAFADDAKWPALPTAVAALAARF